MQGELFGLKNAGSVLDSAKLNPSQPNWLDHFRFTLRLDHLAVAGITALVLYVLVFSFGVEKGKRIALKEIRSERIKQRQVAQELLKSQPATGVPSPFGMDGPNAAPSQETLAVEPLVARPVQSSAPLNAKYTIQVITFTNRAKAEEKVEEFKVKGFQAFIIPGGKFFQVCVDGFEKMTEAKAKLFQLKQDGFAPSDAYIRPLSGQVSF